MGGEGAGGDELGLSVEETTGVEEVGWEAEVIHEGDLSRVLVVVTLSGGDELATHTVTRPLLPQCESPTWFVTVISRHDQER